MKHIMKAMRLLFLPAAYCWQKSDDVYSVNAEPIDEAESMLWFMLGMAAWVGACVVAVAGLIVVGLAVEWFVLGGWSA